MKKILSLILALIMMLSCATMIFAEDTVLSDETPVEVDETASAYYEAVKFLVAYDIMHGKGETLGVYDDIQRYEMALFMGRILTGWVEDSTWEDGTLNSSEFTDLAGTPAEKFYGAISYVNQKGVIEGYGNGKFGPTDGITYQDALTMAVRALGYNGLSYPWGYIETAISLGLTDGITGVVFTDTLKREVVAQIVYNALFATNKAGTTLAESVFDLSLAWTNIIITKTDAATDDVPANYVGFSIFNADGTIDPEVYYVEAAQLGLDGVHDDEKAWGSVYKVMFDTEAEFGLNKVIAYESLELETIANTGRLDTVVGGLPIQAFLADIDIVTAYTQKNFLNTTPEIIIADGLGILTGAVANNYYAVDWATGNILYVDEEQYDELWACGWYNEDVTDADGKHWVRATFVPDYSKADNGRWGLDAWLDATGRWDEGDGEAWHILSVLGADTLDPWKCKFCGYNYSYDQHNSKSTCGFESMVSYGVVAHTVSEVLWYYNAELDMYFQLQVTGVVDGVPVLGVKYMTAAERAELDTLLNTYNYYTYDKVVVMEAKNVDVENAYASLRVFDINADDAADYGIFETYRFGVISNTTLWCDECNDGDGNYVAGYKVTDISNTPVGTTSTALAVKAEAGCKHGEAWISDGSEVVDGTYVIYGYNPATGELKIVKSITGTAEEDEDNYIGYGYIRAYNVTNNQITISTADGDIKVNYNYTALEGTIAKSMLTTHNSESGKKGEGFPAIANRYLSGLFNQYVEFVMVDDRLVYVELEGASDNFIVVEKYAGLHEDGSIVVWGYEIGADKTATKLEQFRINSFNGWAKGDWYNYSWLYEAEIEAAFTRGSIYEIKSYDPAAEGYNVTIVASAADKDYFAKGEYTELTYEDAKVGGMKIGTKTAGGKISRRMAASDKYVFIYDIDDVKGYNAIPIVTYTGIVTNPAAYVKGYRIGSTDGQFIFYIDDEANVKGFAGAAEQGYGLVMFLEWGSNSAYDSYTGKDYLVGSTVRTAYVLDLYTSRMKEITVYPGNYVAATFSQMSGTLGDGYTDNVAAGFIWFNEVKGYVYQTVNGVLVDDTPVKPSDIPAIFAKTVTGTNIMTDALVLETGKYLAKYNGTKLDQGLNWGADVYYGVNFNQNDNYTDMNYGDYEGLSAIAINTRMTLKALGTAYAELAPYALAVKNKESILINAMKADGDKLIVKTLCQGGNFNLKIQGNNNYSWKTSNGYDSMLNWFGDASNNTQAYNYSLIYHSDINGSAAAANKNSASYAVAYLYDFTDDADLRDSSKVNPNKSLVDGFTAPNYSYAAPVVPQPEKIVPVMKTERLYLDNVVGYFDLNEGTITGKKTDGVSGKTFDTTFNYLDLSAAQSAFADGTFSLAFWVRPVSITSDPAIIATQDWNAGSSVGFGIYQDDSELYFNFGDGNGDHRTKIYVDCLQAETWKQVIMTCDNGLITVYIGGEKKAEQQLADGFDLSKLVGVGFNGGWDGSATYADADRFDGKIDDIVVTSDVMSAVEIANLTGTEVPETVAYRVLAVNAILGNGANKTEYVVYNWATGAVENITTTKTDLVVGADYDANLNAITVKTGLVTDKGVATINGAAVTLHSKVGAAKISGTTATAVDVATLNGEFVSYIESAAGTICGIIVEGKLAFAASYDEDEHTIDIISALTTETFKAYFDGKQVVVNSIGTLSLEDCTVSIDGKIVVALADDVTVAGGEVVKFTLNGASFEATVQ